LGFAQTNDITVFTENGEAFTLFVNSAKQNDVPAANVKAKNISGNSYQLRLVFLDKSIPELTSRYYTEERNVEITMIAKQNNKGKWNLSSRGESPRVMEATSEANRGHGSQRQQQNNTPAPTDGTISMNINDGTENVNINMSVSETGIGVQTNTGEESINLNMNMSVGGITTTMTTTTTTTTTTTSSGSNIGSVPATPAPAPAPTPAPTGRCAQPMTAADFREAQSSIDKQKFSDSKKNVAKQVIKNSCITSDQVRDLLKLFTYENDRIEIAKYAYEFVFDADKYYKVNDGFQYSSSVDELNKFINAR
jgi:hypothetical protein